MSFEEIVAKARSKLRYADMEHTLRVIVAASEENSASPPVLGQLRNWAKEDEGRRSVVAAGSFGYYDLEPIVVVTKPGRLSVLYRNVAEETVSSLIRDFFEGDNPSSDLALCTYGGGSVDAIPRAEDIPLFNLQYRIALRNCGFTDPQDIDEYIAGHDGYAALANALRIGPAAVIGEVREAGLRGRGGAGYMTADKWMVVKDAEGSEKYVVCNGVDGDPSARTARLLLESDPHSVLEGLLIAAYAVGASHCIIAITAGSGCVSQRLGTALAQMKQAGFLGDGILGSTFNCDIEVSEVAPSLVAGEETALLRSLEGKQPMPYMQEGDDRTALQLTGRPALINNVETLANVSAVLLKGADWFGRSGTATSAGSKVITLAGAARHQYTVEVPFGTELGAVVRNIGGAGEDGIKAVQFGGPTGAYLGPGDFSVQIDHEAIRASGSVIGWGTVEVVPAATCAVEMTERLLGYLHSQSCGKCVFCREGLFQMADIVKDIATGEGKATDLDLLAELGEEMRIGSICGFGRSAPNPVLSSMRLFRQEYDIHIKEKKCPVR